ncbi:MAG: hypothetical protein ACI4M6_01190 [Christensenellaceae bacterium]
MKGLKFGNYSKKRVRLFDFSGGINGSVDTKLYQDRFFDFAVNFDSSNKSLRDGHGYDKLYFYQPNLGTYQELPFGVFPLKGYFFKMYDKTSEEYDDRMLVYCTDKNVYESHIYKTGSNLTKVEGLSFETAPQAVCYKLNGDDVLIFGDGNGLKVYDGSGVTTVDDAPEITSMCIHNERLFITCGGERSCLFFSDDFDPTNWSVSLTEAGFIDFQDGLGSLVKVVSFNDYVYLFRRYGITKVYAYGDQSEFYATPVLSGCPQIKDDCVYLCGDEVIYLTDVGFYSFNGSYSRKIMSGLDKYLCTYTKNHPFGDYYNGELFIHTMLIIDGKTEKYVVVYNTASGWFYLMEDIDIRGMKTINAENLNELVLFRGGDSKVYFLTDKAQVLNAPMTKRIRTAFGDFDIRGSKILSYIRLYTDKPLTIRIKTDFEEKIIEVQGSASNQKIPVGIKCNSLSIELISNELEAEISKVECEFLTSG